jgi:hypothetical protein
MVMTVLTVIQFYSGSIGEIINEIKIKKSLGNDLLSRGLTPQVPSALTSLTTGFGMGPGVPTSLESPRDFFYEVFLNSIVG